MTHDERAREDIRRLVRRFWVIAAGVLIGALPGGLFVGLYSYFEMTDSTVLPPGAFSWSWLPAILVSLLVALGGALVGGIVATLIAFAPEQRGSTCRKCGYPLLGLPELRCPECGTSFDGGGPEA